MKEISLTVGEVKVSREPVIFKTILGSCVAVCLWDGARKIGGMNHFLLPRGYNRSANPCCYGREAIERLVRGMLEIGAEKKDLSAKVFGGGCVVKELAERFDIGTQNVCVALEVLAEHGIPIEKRFTCGPCGLKLHFDSHTGTALIEPVRMDEATDVISAGVRRMEVK